MVKHVVLFKFKDKADAAEAQRLLLSMLGKVPTVIAVEAHTDELGTPRSCDVMLEVLVKDFAALAEYQKDPYHVDVVKAFIHGRVESSVAADFTI